MKHLLLATVALLGGATLALAQDRKLGTAVEWETSVDEAAARALKESKLLLVLHVSGHFDKPEFT